MIELRRVRGRRRKGQQRKKQTPTDQRATSPSEWLSVPVRATIAGIPIAACVVIPQQLVHWTASVTMGVVVALFVLLLPRLTKSVPRLAFGVVVAAVSLATVFVAGLQPYFPVRVDRWTVHPYKPGEHPMISMHMVSSEPSIDAHSGYVTHLNQQTLSEDEREAFEDQLWERMRDLRGSVSPPTNRRLKIVQARCIRPPLQARSR